MGFFLFLLTRFTEKMCNKLFCDKTFCHKKVCNTFFERKSWKRRTDKVPTIALFTFAGKKPLKCPTNNSRHGSLNNFHLFFFARKSNSDWRNELRIIFYVFTTIFSIFRSPHKHLDHHPLKDKINGHSTQHVVRGPFINYVSQEGGFETCMT